jgi:hypothetical protein
MHIVAHAFVQAVALSLPGCHSGAFGWIVGNTELIQDLVPNSPYVRLCDELTGLDCASYSQRLV